MIDLAILGMIMPVYRWWRCFHRMKEISKKLKDSLDKKIILMAFLSFIVSGCACLYFRQTEPPPYPPPRYTLREWPYEEYWTGIVFNRRKIGFSHLAVTPAKDGGEVYEIHAEAVFLLRFLGVSKKVILKSYDQVRDDLTLVRFSYVYSIDDHNLRLTGKVSESCLEVSISTDYDTKRQIIKLAEKLYPTSAISLYPVFHGLKLGKTYAYVVYDGETQQITRVTQRIGAYQKSELFPGNAYKVVTTMHGQRTTTWINNMGIPSRVINGLVYSEESQGFLYHSWAESYVSGKWIPVDPIFDTVVVDATHIKLLEGETAADCLPLVEMVGKIKSRVLSFSHP
jgi:hypothetical protein